MLWTLNQFSHLYSTKSMDSEWRMQCWCKVLTLLIPSITWIFHKIKLIVQKVPGNCRFYKQTDEFTSTVSWYSGASFNYS